MHFLFSAVFGFTIFLLVMLDVLTSSGEGQSHLLDAMCWLLQILNAPMARFFGLSDSRHIFDLPLILFAAAWSIVLGYAVSLIWRRVEKSLPQTENEGWAGYCG